MRSDEISQFLQERIDANDFPSAVYLVAEKGEIIFQDALGYAVVEPERIEARLDTIYDLASLTKVLVTGLLTTILIENHKIVRSESISEYLEAVVPNTKTDITVFKLLSHTSGFVNWLPFYLLVSEPSKIVDEILAAPLAVEIWQAFKSFEREMDSPVPEKPLPVVYSDLNFLTLMAINNRLLGESMEMAAMRYIFQPLGLERTLFDPPSNLRQSIAASEFGNFYERQTCAQLGYFAGDERDWKLEYERTGVDWFEYNWREYQIWGEVHDGNAWFMGGVAGHAGLFSTAEEVFKIALQFLPNYTTLLRPETCELFRTNFTKGMNEDRSLAFQLASTEGSTAGSLMSRESFGHNGFTGTSLWVDPVKERIFVLLTNRTHAHPLPFVNINSTRRRFNDLAVTLLDEKR